MNFVNFLLFAVFTEGFVDYLFEGGKFDKYKKYVALAMGIALAVAYDLDLVETIIGIEPAVPYLGQVITGTIIGRGSNYLSDLWTTVRDMKK